MRLFSHWSFCSLLCFSLLLLFFFFFFWLPVNARCGECIQGQHRSVLFSLLLGSCCGLHFPAASCPALGEMCLLSESYHTTREIEVCRKNVINYVLIPFFDFVRYLFALSKVSAYLSGRPLNLSYCSAPVAVMVFLLFRFRQGNSVIHLHWWNAAALSQLKLWVALYHQYGLLACLSTVREGGFTCSCKKWICDGCTSEVWGTAIKKGGLFADGYYLRDACMNAFSGIGCWHPAVMAVATLAKSGFLCHLRCHPFWGSRLKETVLHACTYWGK